MPNGDNYSLRIEGLGITALPDGVKIPVKVIGGGKYKYSLDLKDIPKDKRYLSIEIEVRWV